MKMVFLRVTLLHGHSFQMQMQEAEAEATIKAWLEGKLPDRLAGKEAVKDGIAWGIKTSCIQALHTFDPAVQAVGQTYPAQPWKGSGLGRN